MSPWSSVVRGVLREHAHRVLARRCDASGRTRVWKYSSAKPGLGTPRVHASNAACASSIAGRDRHHRAARPVRVRNAREPRQPVEAAVDLHAPGSVIRQPSIAVAGTRRDVARRAAAERAPRVRVRDDRRGRGSSSPPSSTHALARADLGDGHARPRAPRRPRARPPRSRTTPCPCRPRRSPTPSASPSSSPAKCMSLIDAVPGSRGPAHAPMTPWP